MRRPLRPSLLCIGLLAVVLQVFAPGWAAIAMARQAVGTLDAAAICSAAHAPDDTSGQAKHQHAVCPICHVAALSQHVLLPEQAVAAPARASIALRHPHADTAAPRGPPALATRARGPPTLS